MIENKFSDELKSNGYSNEERYFEEVNRKLKTKLRKRLVKAPPVNKVSERAIERWETDGGELKKKP